MNIAINGFGRIGKAFLRSVLEDDSKKLSVVAINVGPAPTENLDLFFKYDSVLGNFAGKVSYKNNVLTIDGKDIKIYSESDPKNLPWKKLSIDWVVEASGKFTTKQKASAHTTAGSKKVLITAPSTDEDITIIPGVNDAQYDPTNHTIISLGSCTTNCFAPIVKVIKENFGLLQGFMTTIHAYTNNQALLDSEHKDPRRGRAAACNIIPTSTGADKVITKIYPGLAGKLQGAAIRVPVPLGSLVEFTFITKDELVAEKINQAFKTASMGSLKNILCYTSDPIVSSDIIGSPYSCIFDSSLTKSAGTMGEVSGWYDNEYGYSCRLKDFLLSL
jgi:glyceraldehyde 3-phosphate dehydrogenase